jgi:hypothetical protein
VTKKDPRRKKKYRNQKKEVNETWTMSGMSCSLFATRYYPHPTLLFETLEKVNIFKVSIS